MLDYKFSKSLLESEKMFDKLKETQLRTVGERDLFIKAAALWHILDSDDTAPVGLYNEYERTLEEVRRRGYDSCELVNNIRRANGKYPVIFADLLDDTLPF